MKKHLLFLLFALFLANDFAFGQWAYNSDETCEDPYQIFVRFHIWKRYYYWFSVNDDGGKVAFAGGNLQYNPSLKLFRFAANQWEYVDDADNAILSRSGQKSSNTQAAATYDGWIDLFGWGTSGFHDNADKANKYFHPYDTANKSNLTQNNSHGYGPTGDAQNATVAMDTNSGVRARYDWGNYNFIREFSYDFYNRKLDSTMYARQVWRTLTHDEWNYVITNRRYVEEGTEESYTYATIHYDASNTSRSCPGLILFPDSFFVDSLHLETTTPPFTYGINNSFTTNDINYSVWSKMDSAGCVFLPCAGYREGETLSNTGTAAFYWSAVSADHANGYTTNFSTAGIVTTTQVPRSRGCAVRLVQDIPASYRKK